MPGAEPVITRRIRTVLVCGGRFYKDFERFYRDMCRLQEATGFNVAVHGAARGADSMTNYWAGGRVVEVRSHPADWDLHGKGAGPIRNQKMLDTEHPDAVMAFPGGNGTEDMKRRARNYGLLIILGGG